MFFSESHSSTSAINTLSLHDALPICRQHDLVAFARPHVAEPTLPVPQPTGARAHVALDPAVRSEEHTSELQSRVDLVCRLLLEKQHKRRKQRQPTPDTLSTGKQKYT